MSKEFSRRHVIGAIGASVLLFGCEQVVPQTVLSTPRTENKEEPFKMGEIVVDGRDALYLRNDGTYQIPDLDEYLRRVKAKKHAREPRKVASLKSVTDKYPLIQAPREQAIIDPYTGDIKDAKKFGGEVNLFIAGMLTDQGNLYDEIEGTEDTFVKQRERLEQEGFYHQDNFFYTWGTKRTFNYKAAYKAADTVKPPSQNLPQILDWIKTIKLLLPFAQLNIFIHSLPGIFLADIMENHSDAINNIFLFNSPVRGLEESPLRVVAVKYMKDYIRARFSVEEYVTADLFALWKDPAYQSRLDRLSRNFVRSGRGLYVARAKDDPFVPVESTKLPEAKEVEISTGSGGILDLLTKPLEVLKAHGKPLSEPEIVDKNGKAIGRNLSR